MEIITYQDQYKTAVRELIFEIAEKEFGHHSRNGRPDLSNIKEVYQTQRGNFWLALDSGKLVGTIGLREIGQGIGHFTRFYVDKDYRRKGIGSKLFFTLIEFAKKNNYKKIFLATASDQKAANKFYTKMGLKRIYSPPDELPHSSTDDVFYEIDF
jgi:ribosomal protein S18 acetylase RimI-like enzyme